MWVCYGIKLSIGIKFVSVVFQWLCSDSLYGSIFVSIQLVGYMKVRSIHERYDIYAMMMRNCFNVTVARAVSPLFDIFSAILQRSPLHTEV